MEQYPDAKKVHGMLVVRVDSAIYFSNSNYVRERILRWLTDEEEKLEANHEPRIQFLIVEMSPVTDIDTSGIHALEELHRSLQKREIQNAKESSWDTQYRTESIPFLGFIQLLLANPGQTVIDKLHASKFPDMIGEDKIFLTVADAVRTWSTKAKKEQV
ncbi:Sulfate transporter 1.3 [Asimina triloba]